MTKKVGVAVIRNRIRRRLKEALRAASPLRPGPSAITWSWPGAEALARPFAVLVDDLRQAFRAIGRIDKDGRRPGAVNTPKGKNRRP